MRHPRLVTCAVSAIFLGLPAAIAQAPNTPGMKEFGVDISDAGKTPTERRAFIDKLTAEQQAEIRRGCIIQMAEPDGKDPVVVAFCRDIGQ